MNTQEKQQQLQGNYLNWNAGDIFEANFMFPSMFFKDEATMRSLTDEEYSEFFSKILADLNLTDYEKRALTASVKSNNRLRVTYHIEKVLTRHGVSLDDTQLSGLKSYPEDEVMNHFDHVVYQVVDKEDFENCDEVVSPQVEDN